MGADASTVCVFERLLWGWHDLLPEARVGKRVIEDEGTVRSGVSSWWAASCSPVLPKGARS